MKSNNEFFSKLKYGDFIVVFFVVAVSAVLFAFSLFGSEKLVAEISLDGEVFQTQELFSLEEEKILQVGDCEILLEKDGVTFLSSSCPDKLCINRGRLEKAGDTMACVPERVTVVLKKAKGGNDIDSVAF